MKTFYGLSLLILSFILQLSVTAQSDWLEELQNYRDSLNRSFADEEVSILTDEKRKKFDSLIYFAPDPNWKIPVKVKLKRRGKEFKMMTTTERQPVYKPYAVVKFKRGGKKHKLTVYQSPDIMKIPGYEDYLFLPFTDLTNGVDTYGGGRYLEFRIVELKEGVVDFNYAYNPYCAYNPKYSCPIPPLENHLDLRVEAGVQYQADF